MAIAVMQKDGTKRYMCSYCKKVYVDPFKADDCRDKHDLVYIQMARSDVGRLVQFIYTGDEKLLTRTMIESLKSIKPALYAEKK